MAKRSNEVWAKWRALVGEQSRSGQTAAAFCQEHGISVTYFFEWRRKLSEAEARAGQFVEVRVTPAQSRALEVRLTGGRSVMVEPGFDGAHLRAVLAVLEERA
jgi:transposase-like protein